MGFFLVAFFFTAAACLAATCGWEFAFLAAGFFVAGFFEADFFARDLPPVFLPLPAKTLSQLSEYCCVEPTRVMLMGVGRR